MSWLLLSCCLAAFPVASSLPVGREFSDEEVLASQRGFHEAWREHFNQKDWKYCGDAYLDTASLLFELGPAADDFSALANWQSPKVARGREEIHEVWKATMTQLALGRLRACEPTGDFNCTTFVVDDDTVLVKGRFALDKVEGRMDSELWTRVDKEWKIKGAVMEIKNVTKPLVMPSVLPPVETNETVKAEAEPSATAVPVAAPVADDHGVSSDVAEPSTAPAAEAASTVASTNTSNSSQDVNSSRRAEQHEASLSASRAEGHSLVMWLVFLPTIAAIGVMVRRSQRRREATIAGFEAMLG